MSNIKKLATPEGIIEEEMTSEEIAIREQETAQEQEETRQAQEKAKADKEAKDILIASAKAKLMSGEAMTEEEANLTLHI